MGAESGVANNGSYSSSSLAAGVTGLEVVGLGLLVAECRLG